MLKGGGGSASPIEPIIQRVPLSRTSALKETDTVIPQADLQLLAEKQAAGAAVDYRSNTDLRPAPGQW